MFLLCLPFGPYRFLGIVCCATVTLAGRFAPIYARLEPAHSCRHSRDSALRFKGSHYPGASAIWCAFAAFSARLFGTVDILVCLCPGDYDFIFLAFWSQVQVMSMSPKRSTTPVSD